MAYPIMHDGLAAAVPPIVALVAIAFGAFLAWRVAQVKVRTSGSAAGRDAGREYLLEEEARGEDEVSSFVMLFGRGRKEKEEGHGQRSVGRFLRRRHPPPPFSAFSLSFLLVLFFPLLRRN